MKPAVSSGQNYLAFIPGGVEKELLRLMNGEHQAVTEMLPQGQISDHWF
ncbi:hypothetical protein [Actimicrobium sp. CCI2.3]|nr:hypothetical protein [Actimicrobium sp. CCI2.3]MDY7574607.1 hypothetical protein [Actimicrobium sp. CCI2.3]MEB0023894.1 hypothetical protein [Actimicrobium sp. CCI2.3]